MAKNNMSKTENKSEITVDDEKILIPGYTSVEEFTKDGFKTLIEATKNSNSLPQDGDWDFYNTHESFRNLMSNEGDNILRLINDVLKQQNVHGNIKNRDFDEKIEMIIEANDIILERVANNLDELAGIRKNPELPVEIQTVSAELPVNGSWNRLSNAKITVASSAASPQNVSKSPNSVRLLTAKNIQRPQKFFKDKIDNSKSPWEPQIKDKPNNLKPLAIFLEQTDDGLGEIFCHPYEFELDRFTPLPWQLSPLPEPIPPPRALCDTPLHLVDSPESLQYLVDALRGQQQIAVDLEHHSYRSYLGFTCLLQISTAEEDFLVDTLALRDKLWVLNEVFTKPTVMKVFHGADHDIQWLQRDLSLYVVNMFDTHQAARRLGYPGLSLAYLLRRHCGVDADKRFQLADWRIRPLPLELQTYAREDTHYLTYVAAVMRNELLERGENVLRAVYTASTQICRRRYEKPVVDDTTHLELYRRCKKLFDNRQMHALKALYQWRDTVAREEDESTGYVLPTHMLLQISSLLPREMQGVLACCNPIPPLVRAHLLELHRLVLRAREQPVARPILAEEARARGATQQHHQAGEGNVEHVLRCPHEIIRGEEIRDDLPTLLGHLLQQQNTASSSDKLAPPALLGGLLQRGDSSKLLKQTAKLTVFDTPENSDEDKKKHNVNSKMKRLKFLGPYERYKLVKKYAQAEEKESEEKKGEEKTEKEAEKSRTDNERIAALQEHFKTLAATTAQLSPTIQPAIADPDTYSPSRHSPTSLGQPVARKRKREPSPDLVDIDNTEQQEHNTQQRKQQERQSNVELTTPSSVKQNTTVNQTPNKSEKKKKKNKNKNKQNMQLFNEELQVGQTQKKQQKKQQRNLKKQQRKQEQQQHNLQKGQNSQQQNNQRQQNNQQQKNQKQSNNYQQQQKNISPRGGKRKWNGQNEGSKPKRKRDNNERGGTSGESNTFQPFDYSAVDFRQFQGGAGSAQQAKKMSSNFRGKGTKNKKFDNIGRTNSRSSTFRGRGRGAQRGGW